MPRSVCIIFEATGPYNAIGKIAMAQAEAALAAGWKVSVVAKRLHESLQDRVEWCKLYVPSRLFALQWLTARKFIRRAAGDLSRFDVIHGHQPQIADLCHIFQCHFLTRAAYERKCWLDAPPGIRRGIEAVQKHTVLMAEDQCYRHWNPATHMLFNSELTRETFGTYYGLPASAEVLIYPSPEWSPVSTQERSDARRALRLPLSGIVLGFLGGRHERKGYKRVVEALRGQTDITLAFGGLHSEGFYPSELQGHYVNLAVVEDTSQFYAACDALVLASHFEPYGYVASEAASRGVPTIATDGVGCLPHLIEHGAGLYWNLNQSLSDLVRRISSSREKFISRCQRYTHAYSKQSHDRRLIELYGLAAAQQRKSQVG